MELTGKTRTITVLGREMTFFNQRCRDWTHPYPYTPGDGANLSNSGCGVFGLCHCVQWLTGQVIDPEETADFSCAHGGRGDDGTDRPGLLHAVMAQGRSAAYGFTYHEDGLRNDQDALYDMLLNRQGVALCNLRVGHIVALVAAREVNGEKQVLAIDSYSESASEKVRDNVRELVPGTEITYAVKNESGLVTGVNTASAVFWVTASTPMDFNFLWANK